jgi:hypothetical protein
MRSALAALVAFGALAGAACGPSFQTVYENDARFEHCYALDETPTAAMTRKADCWNDWTKNHTYGQTRDRVEYARARYDALSTVPQLPTDEAMMAAAPGEGTNADTAAAPTPTSAFAPPPKTEARDGGFTPPPDASTADAK